MISSAWLIGENAVVIPVSLVEVPLPHLLTR